MNAETDILTPFVNTDIKMPKSVLDALTLHEFSCLAKQVAIVSPDAVREFLTSRFGEKMAAKFRPEYLIKAPSV